MPSGWKCDLLFKNKIKELIDKYGNDHAKIVKEIMAICGVGEKQAQVNLKAIKQLVDIEKRCDITPSKETILKKFIKKGKFGMPTFTVFNPKVLTSLLELMHEFQFENQNYYSASDKNQWNIIPNDFYHATPKCSVYAVENAQANA